MGHSTLKECWLQKKEKLQKIYDLTVQQGRCIQEKAMEELHGLLAERQALMAEIDAIDKEFQVIGSADNRTANDVGEFQDLLMHIIKLDEQNRNHLNQEFSSLKRRVADIRAGKRARNSYYPSRSANAGYFIDR